MPKFLYIESLEPKKVKIIIFDDKKIIRQKRVAIWSDKILECVDAAAGGLRYLRQVAGIVVHQGPGTFSAVRSGVLAANMLGAALDIPVRAVNNQFNSAVLPAVVGGLFKKKNVVISPLYNREPNITMKRES